LQKAENASIVFTSDSSARLTPAYSGAYGVSKMALEGFAHVLAEELEGGKKIRVNTLVPSPVDSPLRKRAYPGEDKTKLPKMESLAPIYNYLFSDVSFGITGQIIDASNFKI
jgi:NAD(P)-dependent dehydrogenase (short-subunit alcohol dehydrogenase family)